MTLHGINTGDVTPQGNVDPPKVQKNSGYIESDGDEILEDSPVATCFIIAICALVCLALIVIPIWLQVKP